jgi:hypothetical protein
MKTVKAFLVCTVLYFGLAIGAASLIHAADTPKKEPVTIKLVDAESAELAQVQSYASQCQQALTTAINATAGAKLDCSDAVSALAAIQVSNARAGEARQQVLVATYHVMAQVSKRTGQQVDPDKFVVSPDGKSLAEK